MGGFTRLVSKQFGTPITHGHQYQKWDDMPGLTPKQIQYGWDCIRQSDQFWRALDPLVDDGVFWRLAELQHCADVYYVTNRQGVDPRDQTVTWLRYYGISYPTVLISGRKGEVAAALGAHYLLDDKAGNAVFAAYHSPATICCLLNRPYNQFDHEVLGAGVRRVKTVEEFLELVEAAC